MREVKEFLTLDEMKEKCDIADEHTDMLEVCVCSLYYYYYYQNLLFEKMISLRFAARSLEMQPRSEGHHSR